MSVLRASQSISEPESRLDYPRLGLISLGHLTNDAYGGTLSALMPYLVIQATISATVAGFVLLIYLLMSSFLQPIFGVMSDNSGRRFFAIAGPLLVGISASLAGWATLSGQLIGLALLGGLGTAAFHPQAAAMVNRLSADRRGWSMSIFSVGGNIGFAVGPVIAATISIVGLHWSPVIIFPGVVLTILLALYSPLPRVAGTQTNTSGFLRVIRTVWRPLALIVAVIATRSSIQFILIILLPLYFHARGFPAALGSYYAFVLSFAGALGGLLGGHLSDRYGRRTIVVGSLFLSAPFLLVSLLSTGWIVWPLLALAGATLIASNSVTIVQGQEWLAGNPGIASGFTMGFGFGLSGILASAVTALSDHVGAQTAVFTVPVFALVAATLAWWVPDASAAPAGVTTSTHLQSAE